MEIIRVENWAVGISGDNPYQAPELGGPRIGGNAFGHPNYPDGKFLQPSDPKKANPELLIFQGASGRFYQLGDPDSIYLELYPNCIEGIRESFAKLPPLDENIL